MLFYLFSDFEFLVFFFPLLNPRLPLTWTHLRNSTPADAARPKPAPQCEESEHSDANSLVEPSKSARSTPSCVGSILRPVGNKTPPVTKFPQNVVWSPKKAGLPHVPLFVICFPRTPFPPFSYFAALPHKLSSPIRKPSLPLSAILFTGTWPWASDPNTVKRMVPASLAKFHFFPPRRSPRQRTSIVFPPLFHTCACPHSPHDVTGPGFENNSTYLLGLGQRSS